MIITNKNEYSTLPVFKCKDVYRSPELRIYKTIIRPEFCYVCETLLSTKANEKLVNAFERKTLRMILGLSLIHI